MIKFIIEHTLAGGMIFQNTFEAHSIHISCLISWNSHRERIAGMDGLIIKREESWLGVKQNKSYSKSTMQSLIPAVVNDDFFFQENNKNIFLTAVTIPCILEICD